MDHSSPSSPAASVLEVDPPGSVGLKGPLVQLGAHALMCMPSPAAWEPQCLADLSQSSRNLLHLGMETPSVL